MVTLTTVIAAIPGKSVFSKTATESVIMGLSTGRYYSLKEVGTRFWELAQNPISIREAAEAIAGEFEVTPEAAGADLIELSDQLIREGLAAVVEPPSR